MTQTVAIALAGIVAALSPLVLRYVKLDGLGMSAASYGVALLITLLAAWLTGEFTLSRAGVVAVLTGSTAVWSIQQLVYAVLKQYLPQVIITPQGTLRTIPGPGSKTL